MRKNYFSGLMLIILIGSMILAGCTRDELNQATTNAIKNGQQFIDGTKNFLTNQTKINQTKVNLSSYIAHSIISANLKEIDVKKIQTYDGYKDMIDKLNLMIQIVNEKAGTDIKYVSKEIEAYNKFTIEVEKWTPLVNNYNELISVSYGYTPSNIETSDLLLQKTAGFTVESVLIVSGAFYKATYKIVGNFAHHFGLTKVASVCGACVSNVMSGGHWIIRNGAIEKVSGFAENAINATTT